MSSTRVKKQPRSASSNKSPVSGKQGGNSPVRDAETASQLYIKLKYNREKLCHTLDTYTLLARSKNPIRCL